MAPRRIPGPAGGWLSSLLAVTGLGLVGFVLGLLAGGVVEAPDLVLGHLLGETETIAWGPEPGAAPIAGADAVTAVRPEGAPPPVAAAPPSAPGAPLPRGRFSIQVGAFRESAAAEKLADRLRARGYEVYLAAGAREGEARWRVRVGPLGSRGDAERTAASLKSAEQLPTWVLSEDAGAP